jgi:hypothetical protein
MPGALLGALVAASMLLTACMAEVQRTSSSEPVVSSGHPKSIELARDVEVDLHTGYKRTLRRDSRWTYVGSINQGDVYRPDGTVLTVEGANVHEAYIVLSSGKLAGFYLPVEKAYVPLAVQPAVSVK